MLKVMKILNQKNIKITFPCSFAYKLVDDRFSKLIAVFRGKNAAYKFIEAILKEYEYCKKVTKKTFQQKFNHD